MLQPLYFIFFSPRPPSVFHMKMVSLSVCPSSPSSSPSRHMSATAPTSHSLSAPLPQCSMFITLCHPVATSEIAHFAPSSPQIATSLELEDTQCTRGAPDHDVRPLNHFIRPPFCSHNKAVSTCLHPCQIQVTQRPWVCQPLGCALTGTCPTVSPTDHNLAQLPHPWLPS
jgi:hypothetical protein